MKDKPFLRSIELRDGFDKKKYPFNIPSIANLELIEFHDGVTFFVGENGSGKSTLLEAIALTMGFTAQGGSKDHIIEDDAGDSGLHEFLKATKSYPGPKSSFFLRAESFYNVATYTDRLGSTRYGGGRSLHRQSHGESFMAALVDGFGPKGLYLLDEPEAALSPSRLMAALVRIDDLVKSGSQFIIATHSPILMAYPRSKIVMFDENGISEIEYEKTEHFSITRDFLNNYSKRLEQLFDS